MGEPPPPFYDAVLTLERTVKNHKFRGLNVTMNAKKSTFLRGGCVPAEKILAKRMREGPPPYVGLGQWLIRHRV